MTPGALRHGLADGLRFRDFYIPPTEGAPRIYVVKDQMDNRVLLEAEDGPVVCEVNSNAHFAGLLSATGVNPADHIMQYIRRTVCEE